LTRLHGFPARLVIPGLYGFKQVKWLSEIVLASDEHRGYWPQRGWTDQAVIRTTARVDLARPEPGGVRAAGVALAGRRSVSAVEARLVQGENGGAPLTPWVAAELHLPPLSPMAWVQWRVLFPPDAQPVQHAGGSAAGPLYVEARAVDGTGEPQDPTPRTPYPTGSSGYHRAPVRA
jgi:hypothetical protein